jgi:hypothetical protein
MGLLANNFRDTLGAFQTFGATASNNAYPSATLQNHHRTAANRNLTAGEGITSELVAVPSGNRHPSAWVMPQQAGALAARNTLTGDGGITDADLWAVKLALADLTGSGELTAVGSLVVQLIAAITGSGTISAANLQAFLAAVANLTGSGGVTDADLEGFGAMLAALAGDGTLDASVLTGVGELNADLVVTGTGLSTANVGQAVWSALLEAGFTAEDLLRLAAAGAAAKLSGAAGTEIVIRDVSDQHDLITATVDADGNRSAITLDLTQ